MQALQHQHTKRITEESDLSMQNINSLLWCFTENLELMEISLDLKLAHNPQLLKCNVLQI